MGVFEELPPEEPEVRTLTDLVKHIENTLGWCPSWDDPRPVWKVRAIEVGKMKRIIAKDPKRYSMENLLLAVEYLRRHRRPVTSPAGVLYAVDKALKESPRARPQASLDDELEAAVARVRSMPEGEDRHRWERRLAVSRGAALRRALDELEASWAT